MCRDFSLEARRFDNPGWKGVLGRMAEPLKILLAEDSESDAELVQRELKRGGLDFQSRRVQTETDFRRELDELQPHLVISDFSMPQFSGPKALAIARESQADIPFIFISGTIGENVAVDMMKAGADDYVMKNNLARLLPALKRELREAEVRRARRLAEAALRESEVKYRELIEQASDGIFVTDKEGHFILANSRYCEMLGYSRDELLRLHSEATYPEEEREKRAQHRAEVRERKTSLYERMIRRRDGTCFPAEVSIKLLGNDNVQGIIRDITARKEAEARIHRLHRVYAVLSGINALIVRVSDREELFRGACRIAVEAGQFPMAWVGVVDRETKRVKPVAWCGEAEEFLASAPLSMSQSRAVGRGMSGSAIEEKKAVIANDIQNDPRTQMKEQCKERGINSLAFLPLIIGNEGIGVLALYASETGFFDDEEMKLLLELAGDISFALDHSAKGEKLDSLAYYASLTGLANRTLFHERLVQYVSAAQSEKSGLAVAVVDVDRFKIINDSLGRQAGDELLRQIAERIEGHAGPIRMARISADRFAIARSGVSSESEVARRIDSVAALIRWQSPELGLVPPMQFIPLLEETGLILEVGAWALRRAVVDHRTWTEQGLPAPRISVNVSSVQLRQRDFVATVEEAIKAGSVPPGIDLEITERLVMEDIEANMRKLEAVRVLGVSIAIDDFGTGYSSLGYLAKLPVQSLKIDRSFIITMLKDPAIMTLVSTIISMAHSLRLKVVAEGVDAEEQAEELDRLGCDQLQGYLFSKPLPFDDVMALLGRAPGKGKARRKS